MAPEVLADEGMTQSLMPTLAAQFGFSALRGDAYGRFGVLYSTSFWNESQTVS
jgi:hypothetical protein